MHGYICANCGASLTRDSADFEDGRYVCCDSISCARAVRADAQDWDDSSESLRQSDYDEREARCGMYRHGEEG